jgi:hypothetical protein
MSQWINFRALKWAYDQESLSVTAKAVLITLAIHANESGYTWPGVDRIASAWGMDRETVRRQIEALLVRRKVYRTKKRRGATGQVKVYRLPKITYESGGKCRSFGNHESGGKARDKRGGSGGKSAPNNDYDITTNTNHDGVATCNSIPSTLDNRNAQSVSSLSLGYQNQPPQTHAKWPEFAAWCRSKGGTPTETGFWKWLRGQKPQWRNKIKKAFDETGYEFNGKFLRSDEANRLGRENPDSLTKFRKAVRRDGKIEIIRN